MALAERNRLYYWDLHDRLYKSSIGAHNGGPVASIHFDRTGGRIASCGEDGSLRIWDVRQHRQLACYLPQSRDGNANCLDWSGDVIAAGCKDGKIRLFDAATLAQSDTLDYEGDAVLRIQFSPSGQWLATAGSGNHVWIWDLQQGKVVEKLKTITTPRFAFSPGSDSIAFGIGSAVTIHKLPVRQSQSHLLDHVDEYVDHKQRSSAAADRNRRRMSFMGTLTMSLPWPFRHRAAISAVACAGGEIRVWDLSPQRGDATTQREKILDPTTLFTLHGHDKSVRAMIFSSDGSLLVSGGDDGTIRIWDTASGEQTGFIQTDSGNIQTASGVVTQLSFAPEWQTFSIRK